MALRACLLAAFVGGCDRQPGPVSSANAEALGGRRLRPLWLSRTPRPTSGGGSGVLAIKTPSGATLRFEHERIVEHPSGGRTWIGRPENGTELDRTILSFGEGGNG